MNFQHLTKNQTSILKGVGILLIVLHNYFHNLTPKIGEQEFFFSQKAADNFLAIVQTSPSEIARIFFSYFGHYGVQIFIFLSAYGFTRKYADTSLPYFRFFKERTAKIYSAFFVCVMLYVALGLAKGYFSGESEVLWKNLLWKLSMVSNFVPNEAMMPVGPWWFFSLIIQIYLVFPLLLQGHKKYGAPFLLCIALASIATEMVFGTVIRTHDLNINHTVFGHLPVLCMGVYWGCSPSFRISGPAFVAALCFFIAANFHPLLWMGADVAFIVFFLYAQSHFLNYLSTRPTVERVFLYFGDISLYLFLVNGFLRSPFHNFAQSHDTWWITNLVAIASLIFSTLFAILLQRLDSLPRLLRRDSLPRLLRRSR